MCSTSFGSRQRAQRRRHGVLVEEKRPAGENAEKTFGRFWQRGLLGTFFACCTARPQSCRFPLGAACCSRRCVDAVSPSNPVSSSCARRRDRSADRDAPWCYLTYGCLRTFARRTSYALSRPGQIGAERGRRRNRSRTRAICSSSQPRPGSSSSLCSIAPRSSRRAAGW